MIKNELKTKILNDLNNYKYYEISENDNIKNIKDITIDGVKYNIYDFTCYDCGKTTRFITGLDCNELENELINDDVYYYYDNELVCNDCVNYSGNYSRCYYCDELNS